MSTRFLGVGPGVVIIVTIWVSALLLAFITTKIKRPTSFVGAFGVVTAFILTAVLLCIPREQKTEVVQTVVAEQDTLFIWRIALFTLELCSLLVAAIFMITEHWAVPVKAKILTVPSRGIVSLISR